MKYQSIPLYLFGNRFLLYVTIATLVSVVPSALFVLAALRISIWLDAWLHSVLISGNS